MAKQSNVTNFKRGLGNGAASFAAYAAAVHGTIETRNANEIAQMLDAAAEKNDSNAVAFFKKLTARIFDGSTIGKNKNGGYVVRIKKATLTNSALNDMDMAVKAGLSFRSNDAKALIGGGNGAEWTIEKDAKNTAKRLIRNEAALEAYIAKLREEFAAQQEPAAAAA